MRLAPYRKYKTTEVLGHSLIPDHWDMRKVTRSFDHIGSGTTPNTNSNDFYDGDIPWVTTAELRETTITFTQKNLTIKALADHSALTFYSAGAIAIAMYGATIGRLGILGVAATVNQACCVFDRSRVLDNKYFYYWLWSYRPTLISLSNGGGQPNLSQDDLRSLSTPVPPLPEQHAIAAFLDRETARIDALVEKKRRLLALLEEKRLAVITHAVTKGLDPKAKMKTGIGYWMDCIPRHWALIRIANLTTKITNGFVGPTRDILVDSGTRYIQSLHVKNGRILFDRGPYFVTDEWSAAHSKSVLRLGDVLVVQTGAEVGQTALVDRNHEGCNCHALIIMTPRSEMLRGAFLELYLRSDIGRKYLHSIETGALHPHLNCTLIRDLYVPMPPTLEEQDRIVESIANDVAVFDRVRVKIDQAIGVFLEYRSALITNAVTGKIKVA
jgi:type I restriction enzyme, S subunit